MAIENNKLYYVLPSDMAKQLDYNSLEEKSYSYVRTSADGVMAIVEYKGDLSVRGGSYYTHEEALKLMQTPEWASPDDTIFTDI